ncbi:aldehyde dehydrogenase [Jannaschia sp. Os4]|uniref:type I glyceraldehyde-3-phosphate dehydrogenase n=1 Tax=Jannaschia sp. Os4 TaxID=2807617 RepID=UPI00193AA9A4|nr:glyceraldehyde 3-phosphate dehydrogenase NAD-binding domain-containing protein [Jannaschia sp. Os4]MBM2576180.1 aldehyde dehydrogenase [Jannaschia sp. Os4]
MTRVLINGFGRIGRSILRAHLRGRGNLVVAGINDIAPPETCAYLMRWDSVFGPWPEEVAAEPGALRVGRHRIPFHSTDDLSTLDLSDIDLVLECTGHADTRDEVERGLRAGARRILMSGPSTVADATIVIGANDHLLADQRVVSNASCTTNAVAPLLKALDDAFGVETGSMTTIHCYTGSQPTVDTAHGPHLARSRAAALSMVPTTTSAGRLVDEVLPHLAGRVPCQSVRVPTASVSAVDLSVMLRAPATAAEVDDAILASPVIGAETDEVVSADMRMRPESYVHLPAETRVAGSGTRGGMVRVFGWYDNEWGFACRMLDLAERMA